MAAFTISALFWSAFLCSAACLIHPSNYPIPRKFAQNVIFRDEEAWPTSKEYYDATCPRRIQVSRGRRTSSTLANTPPLCPVTLQVWPSSSSIDRHHFILWPSRQIPITSHKVRYIIFRLFHLISSHPSCPGLSPSVSAYDANPAQHTRYKQVPTTGSRNMILMIMVINRRADDEPVCDI